MIEIILTSLVIVMANLVYLSVQFFKMKNRVQILEGKRTTKDIILKPIPQRPVLSDIDPGHKVLKDILESIEIENWTSEVKEDPSAYSGTTYSLTLTNPSDTLSVMIRLRMRKGDEETYEPYLSNFIVYSTQNEQHTSLAFDDEHPLRNEMVLLTWNYIIKYHEDINKNISNSYIKSIDSIKKKLTTLNRDRKLNTLI